MDLIYIGHQCHRTKYQPATYFTSDEFVGLPCFLLPAFSEHQVTSWRLAWNCSECIFILRYTRNSNNIITIHQGHCVYELVVQFSSISVLEGEEKHNAITATFSQAGRRQSIPVQVLIEYEWKGQADHSSQRGSHRRKQRVDSFNKITSKWLYGLYDGCLPVFCSDQVWDRGFESYVTNDCDAVSTC